MTALRPDSGLVRTTYDWPGGIAPFAAPLGVRAGPIVFLSGLLGHDDGGRLAASNAGLPPGLPAGLADLQAPLAGQCWWALRRLLAAADAVGGTIAKCTVTLACPEDLQVWERIRQALVPHPGFAFEAIAVHGPGPVPNARVQLDAILASS